MEAKEIAELWSASQQKGGGAMSGEIQENDARGMKIWRCFPTKNCPCLAALALAGMIQEVYPEAILEAKEKQWSE